MKKIYLVKKDPDKPSSEGNWIIMNGSQFARFMETEDGQRRKKSFARIPRCCKTDDYITLECGEEAAKKVDLENKKEKRHRRNNLKTGRTEGRLFLLIPWLTQTAVLQARNVWKMTASVSWTK